MNQPRISAMLHLEYLLRALQWDLARKVGLTADPFPRAPTDAMDVADHERLGEELEKGIRDGSVAKELLAAIAIFDQKTSPMRQRSLGENLASLAMHVVKRRKTPAEAAKIARLWGGGARASKVEQALAKEHREHEIHVKNVYVALSEGLPAPGTREKMQAEGRSSAARYAGLREPLRSLILGVVRDERLRLRAKDIAAARNVTAVPTSSGSQCPTPDVTGAAKKASLRRKISKKK
jgi:hypothetical protein